MCQVISTSTRQNLPSDSLMIISENYLKAGKLCTVHLLVPGHFHYCAVSIFSLRENDISVLLL